MSFPFFLYPYLANAKLLVFTSSTSL